MVYVYRNSFSKLSLMNLDQVLNLASISAKLKDFVKEIFEISNSNTYNVKGRERFMMFFHFLIPCSYCMSYKCVLNGICQTTSAPAFVSLCDVLCHLPIQPLFTCTKKHFWHLWGVVNGLGLHTQVH